MREEAGQVSGRGLLRRWVDGVRRVIGIERRSREPHPEVSTGGPFLHWVPDRDGGLRLAGDFLPPSQRRAPQPPTRSRRRSRRV